MVFTALTVIFFNSTLHYSLFWIFLICIPSPCTFGSVISCVSLTFGMASFLHAWHSWMLLCYWYIQHFNNSWRGSRWKLAKLDLVIAKGNLAMVAPLLFKTLFLITNTGNHITHTYNNHRLNATKLK